MWGWCTFRMNTLRRNMTVIRDGTLNLAQRYRKMITEAMHLMILLHIVLLKAYRKVTSGITVR